LNFGNFKVLNPEKAFENKQCPFESGSEASITSERSPFDADIEAEAASRKSAFIRESKCKGSFMGHSSRNITEIDYLKGTKSLTFMSASSRTQLTELKKPKNGKTLRGSFGSPAPETLRLQTEPKKESLLLG